MELLSDGYHIGLLIMAALRYLAPEFIKEGRLCWLRSPLYIVTNKNERQYYYTDKELENAKSKGLVKGEITRAKGLGELEDYEAKESMFSEKYQKLDIMEWSSDAMSLLEQLMGTDVKPRTDFIFKNIDFSEIRE